MENDRKVNCLLENGVCPEECPNYEMAQEITEKLGDRFDPFLARLTVVFGDGIFEGVSLKHVVAAMARCATEKPLRQTESA